MNRARFGRDEKEDKGRNKVVIRGQVGAELVEGVSFKNKVLGKEEVGSNRCLVIEPSSDMMELLQHGYVGVLKLNRDPKQIQQELVMEGVDQISVTYLGEMMVLLQALEPGCVERAQLNHKPWWKAHFREVKKWTPNIVSKRRSVWLRIHGLPIHVWEERVFKKLGALFGDCVDFEEATITRRRFDRALIKVSTGRMSFIDEVVRVKVVGAVFDVFVVEVGGSEVSEVKGEAVALEEESVGSFVGEEVVGSEL